jgi:hypothetical protein
MARTPHPPSREELALAAFRTQWRLLARAGACDDIDGEEYQRVFAAWLACGLPREIGVFISREANRPPR